MKTVITNETRAAWVNPGAYVGLADRIIKFVKSANFNLLLVRPVLNEPETMAAFFKFCQRVETETPASVHCWLTSYGDFEVSESRLRAAQSAVEWLAYPGITGIHLDYIRYSGKYSTANDLPSWAGLPRINPAQTAAITNLVSLIRHSLGDVPLSVAARGISDKSKLSGGPYPSDGSFKTSIVGWPYYDSKGQAIFWPRNTPYMRENQQDCLAWLTQGLVDVAFRMSYTSILGDWSFEADQWAQSAPVDRVGMGLGWYTGDGSTSQSKEDIIAKIQYARGIGIKHFALFQLGHKTSTEAGDMALAEALAGTVFARATGLASPLNHQE